MANITTLDLGVITPIPKGEYNPVTDYERLNFVTFNGSSWIRTEKEPYVVGSIPQTGSLYWQLMAKKGDAGDKGDKGDDGRTPELSDSIDSASSLIAASSKAIKTVNDKWSAIGTALGQVTEALGQVQVQGAATWSADGAPYPIRAQVYHNDKQWLALRANSVEPTEGADWTELVGKQYIDAATPVKGIITMWYGSIASIPFGWALCDGTNGTPDLRDKFVMGAGGKYAVGEEGGSENQTVTVHPHTLTVEQMPSHGHGAFFIANNESAPPPQRLGTSSVQSKYDLGYTLPAGGSQPHTHGASIESTLPPYYALAYIMKL